MVLSKPSSTNVYEAQAGSLCYINDRRCGAKYLGELNV